MEYRFIPAIAKLISLLPAIGDLKMVTIRETRYPFLDKIGKYEPFEFVVSTATIALVVYSHTN